MGDCPAPSAEGHSTITLVTPERSPITGLAAAEHAVLLVGNFLSATAGTRSVCENLARQLSASGWTVMTISRRRRTRARLFDVVITVRRTRHRYAVAHVDVYSGLAFLWAEVACWTLRKAGKPYVLTLHGGNLPGFSRRWPARVRHLLASATAVTTPSRYLQEQMRPYRDDLRLLPNPLDVSNYRFRLRAQPRPCLVWLRAFHEIYNPSLAPRVVALLAKEFPDINLIMVGPDKGDGSLQAMRQVAKELGVAHHIDLPGGVPHEQVPIWMNKGDIFLNTTNVDNMPVSVLEAMACGLCVISTSVGGIPYLLEHEQDALLIPRDDSVAMAAAVRRVLTQPGFAERLSRRARTRAEQFGWSAVLPQWELLLNAVAAGRPNV